MLRELARPIILLGCILSLLKLFHAAFLEPAATNLQRLEDALGPFLLAAATAMLGALVFLPARRAAAARSLLATFPMQIFCWTTSGMAAIFLLAWYLETHCIFYRDIHF
jgi:hypothetical protein